MKLKQSLVKNAVAMLDIGTVLVISAIFIAMMLIAYVFFTLKPMLFGTGILSSASSDTHSTTLNDAFNTSKNLSIGFDQSINFLVIAIIIFIVAIAISALLFIRKEPGQ